MQLYCRYCDEERVGEVCDSGSIACSYCGNVIMEDYLVAEVQYSKGPGGQSRMQGAFVKSWDAESASLERSLSRGQDQIRLLINSLNMDDVVEEMANRFYRRAAQRSFTRRYKIDHVAAACLYLACRAKEMPYLLIDFSEKLAVNVYVLGAVYLQLCQLLYLEDDPIVQKPVDPSLFIHKFTQALVQKLETESDKVGRVKSINRTALSIIASMKRDWMQTGRKPSGLCGAAIYVAALSEGIRFPKSEVINVVHICEATLTKRLIEFENTESGSLTIDEFTKRAEDFEREQLDACTNKSGRTEVLCKHKEREVYAHGLCKKCSDKFIKLSGGLEWGADPPSFQRSESKEVAQNASEKINDPSTDWSHQEHTLGRKSQDTSGQEENNNMMAAAEKVAEPQIYYNYSVNNKESDDLTNDDPECLSDIDDKEVNCYLNNEEEVRFKKIIWEQMNKEYLEEQALKAAAKAGAYSDTAEMTDEMREAQELAAAASAAVALARKQKRQQRAPDAKNAVPPRTAAEAAAGVLNNKGNRKINMDVLQQLFDEDDAEHASKKSRKDPEDAYKEPEEVDNVNNYDEVDEEYQEQADYEPDPNYDNDHYYDGNEPDPNYNNDHYYDGNDEPGNYGDDWEH